MYTIPPKKMVTINILNILKKYSDMDHRLTQQEIADILKKEYFMEVDRRTVKRNLMSLLDLDCGVDYTEIERKDENGNETSICTDWYIQPQFNDSELRLLIDSLLFSKGIPQTQCRQLIDKLVSLSNIYFDKKVTHICNLPDSQPRNKEVFYTIDILDEAISNNKKVGFMYNSYKADKKLHPNRDREYIVSPYQMVATNGRYYLVCNYDGYENIANYRIDRMTNMRILDERRTPLEQLKEGKLDLPRHMAEHLYMYSGESARVKFKAKEYIVDQVIDWFGKDVEITPLSEDECVVEVTVNREAFFCWALQYALHTEVIEPLDIREKITAAIKTMGEKYGVK